MLKGLSAIIYLGELSRKDDPEASSHWKKYHADFAFDGKSFTGVVGFGGWSKPYRGLRRIIHRGFQRRFRQMAAGFASFSRYDTLAAEIANRQVRGYDLDFLRQALTLGWLDSNVPSSAMGTDVGLVVGDGFASLTSLLVASGRCRRVVLVNLNKTLLVDLCFLREWMGEAAFEQSVALVSAADSVRDIAPEVKIVAIPAECHRSLRQFDIDIAFNIASMQEMDISTVAGYFEDLRAVAARRRLLFYCCNREEKALPDGSVIRFREYPWTSGDRVLADELCPWHQFYYSQVWPFWHPYDGPIRHRLTELAG